MPWWNWKRSPRHLLSSYSPSSASVPTSPGSAAGGGGGGRSRPKDPCVYPSTRFQPQPILTRQTNLRRLTEHELNALCQDAVEEASSSTSVSGSPSNLVAIAAATNSTPISRSPSELYDVQLRSVSSRIVLPRPPPHPESSVSASTLTELKSGQDFCFNPAESVRGPLPSPWEDFGKTNGVGRIGAATESTSLDSLFGRTSSHVYPEQEDILLNKSSIRDRRLPQEPNYASTKDITLNIPAKSVIISEFLSPAGSPVHTPRRSTGVAFLASLIGTRGLHVLSAPDIPHDSVAAFSSQTSPKKMQSPEHSPVYSLATKRHISRPRNHSAPASPLDIAMHSESLTAWHDSGGNVNVHPLPLPPGASPSKQSALSYPCSLKVDVPVVANQWKKRKLIGSGTFGNVYEATNSYSGALCAMKEVNIIPDDSRSAECLKQLEQEIKFLSQFKHPNIVQYYGSEMIEDQLYIYLEYVHPGSVNKYVRTYYGAMTECIVRSFTCHILKGLAYLHDKKIMHSALTAHTMEFWDIKGANLLVDVNGVVKLADFGMAKHLNGATTCHSMKGSAFWMAPEMLKATMNKEIVYDVSVDIWSLGCTIIEMFTGKHPWSDLHEAQAMFKVLHYHPPIPENLSKEGKDFLQRCFRRNPAERPTANWLLEHPFVQNVQQHSLNSPVQPITEIKPTDSTHSPSNRGTPKHCPFVKRKPTATRDNGQSPSYPEKFESAASHLSSPSIPKNFASLSPPSKFTASNAAGSSAPTQHWALPSARKLQSYARHRPHEKDYATSF
ncbi:hypothetical protein ZIOFF_002535 [Zingiber officinale]|uniref:mitogen-activated protein kinase kinase kinase n=1 Tax=Zingiber officinale TaxID=94328 RepID=A0A8J5I5A2_ZINOF|nr:hypothetical protein ZIOFF_002535 [Zingiber officinale]